MERDAAIAEIGRRADALRQGGVAAAYLFGSTARNQAGSDSDVDVFVDIEPGRRFSLVDLVRMEAVLGAALGRRVDLTTRESLHPALRADIERYAVRVF